jgi:hypothetical protein
MAKLSFSTGWGWLKEGTRLFRRQPAVLSFLVFAGFMVTMLLSALIPMAGAVISSLILPAMLLAMYEACRQIDAGQRVAPAVIMTGFRPEVRNRLLLLGVVYAVLLVLNGALIDTSHLQSVQGKAPQQVTDAERSAMQTALLQMAFYMLQLLALAFCAPLIAWKGMGLGKALFYSVAGLFGGLKAMLGMVLSWFGIMLAVLTLAALLTGGSQLGQVLVIWISLHFLVVLYCALYVAYRELFSRTGQGQDSAMAGPTDEPPPERPDEPPAP